MEAHSRQMEALTLSLSLSLQLYIYMCMYLLLIVYVSFRPRLLDFVSSLDEALVKSASQKAFQSLPDISKAVSELTVLKGVGPATASAVLAAYAPDVAPFMSDEAMVAALGNSKDYTLKQYILFVDKLQAKAKELSAKGDTFTPSDVERAVWSSAIGAKLPEPLAKPDLESPVFVASNSGMQCIPVNPLKYMSSVTLLCNVFLLTH
ncbi:hypothetical protein TEA_004147 [Camellia sinensis var. sinensis]|uniref:Uncharacterized protein n=1 Tax=Camellia sinensis var. sinensis TaxID=542762 RepID=A0A4S4D846_CAMSN|nr:hypothetical protein TEA_004147 [Camellia sinensis var. sinensis]